MNTIRSVVLSHDSPFVSQMQALMEARESVGHTAAEPAVQDDGDHGRTMEITEE